MRGRDGGRERTHGSRIESILVEDEAVGSPSLGSGGRSGPSGPAALTPAQRTLVEENLGLVYVHLRRIPNLRHPRHDREWEDLFQEGCLGLMEAVRRYPPQSSIPFAAFALPRIRHAVSAALRRRFHLLPDSFARRAESSRLADLAAPGRGQEVGADRSWITANLEARRLASGPIWDEKGTVPDEPPVCEPTPSIADRMGEHVGRALRRAADALVARASVRDDRHELVELLIRERLAIPDESSRRPLRQIARETQSSFARVAQCETRLRHLVRLALAVDPEFCLLDELVRSRRHEPDHPVGPELEEELVQAAAEELIRRYQVADRAAAGRLLDRVLEGGGQPVAALIHERVARMTLANRWAVLDDVLGFPPGRPVPGERFHSSGPSVEYVKNGPESSRKTDPMRSNRRRSTVRWEGGSESRARCDGPLNRERRVPPSGEFRHDPAIRESPAGGAQVDASNDPEDRPVGPFGKTACFPAKKA